ncbi:hypothetical protein EZL74_11100 [Flavobacterium silvisoli]|uniref:Uncharacterized protein n=1 Tax=Flavobacterium silvisoli TaxID=2529433 RepID=A0A4Q9YRF1_9FLAO|nr:hypothetical protein [Flavobacterium silvisoli]TBX66128.1 hypothetical protein EZL74_11100 [Flavobacterium silvisoli]
MGILHEQFTGWDGVHGSTINSTTFKLIEVLKSIQVQKALNSKGNTVYVTNPVDESWYRIDDYILYNKRIDLYPKWNTSLIEYFEERQD